MVTDGITWDAAPGAWTRSGFWGGLGVFGCFSKQPPPGCALAATFFPSVPPFSPPLPPTGFSPGRALHSWLCSPFLCRPPQSFWELSKTPRRKLPRSLPVSFLPSPAWVPLSIVPWFLQPFGPRGAHAVVGCSPGPSGRTIYCVILCLLK